MIAARVKRWIRIRLERALDRFNEHAHVPPRFSDAAASHVTEWANAHPKATRAEWATFASEMASYAYREAFTRGVEYIERDPTFWDDVDPDAVADIHDPGWREHSPELELRVPHVIVIDDEVLEHIEPLLEPLEDGPRAHDVDLFIRPRHH